MKTLTISAVAAAVLLAGCISEPKRSYSEKFVKTYVDLTMLYEKMKMEQKVPDSTYQVNVRSFFTERGLDQAEFKRQVEVLSNDPQVWKMFIHDVTRQIDSLKMIEYKNGAE
ncbi:MAG: hypothetical protein HUU02_12175 [Bacteroidetes bacterium]|nr:hypothetical protein [Bacteroidota bacterium]